MTEETVSLAANKGFKCPLYDEGYHNLWLSELQKWLRENHGMHPHICWLEDWKWNVDVYLWKEENGLLTSPGSGKGHKSYEDALEHGLKEALKLIKMRNLKIISGGQTGVDQLALKVGKYLGIETGGTAPKGFLTEEGSTPILGSRYGLIEHESPLYPPRTEQNIKDADITLLFGDMNSRGSKLAKSLSVKNYMLLVENPKVEDIKNYIRDGYKTFNIGGNRGSKLSLEERSRIKNVLLEAFK